MMNDFLQYYIICGVLYFCIVITINQIEKYRDKRSEPLKSHEKFLFPFLGALIIITWPFWLYHNIKDTFLPSPDPNAEKFFEEAGRIFQTLKEKPKTPIQEYFNTSGVELKGKADMSAIESDGVVIDPLGCCPGLPFGFMNNRWNEFKSTIEGDTEVMVYEKASDSFIDERTQIGVVAIKDGVVIDHFVTKYITSK